MASNNTADILDIESERLKRQANDFPYSSFENSGAHLKAARKDVGLSIEAVSQKTHMKTNHLQAIEDLDTDALPARPYAIGFVKTYAEFLGLDAEPIVARFKEDAGYSAPLEIEVEKFETAEAAVATEKSNMSIWAVAIVLIFIIWSAWQVTRPRDVRYLGSSGVEAVAPAAIDPATVIGVTAPMVLPEMIEAVRIEGSDPIYPRRCESSAAAKETATVAFTISAAGQVVGERIQRSSNPCFEASALNAVRLWRYQPRTVDGTPAPAYDMTKTFTFTRPL